MKNISFKTILPHLIAVAVFLLITVIFCRPALEPGVVMQQGDYTAADGMKQQSVLYYETHGVYPTWITSMFGGMPSYQIMYSGPYTPMITLDKMFQLWLPKPLNFFFLSCICFYFLCICLRIRPYVAILGSLAFAYSSYNPIIAVAGHDTKLLALAYAPALIGSIILIFDKKYIAGFLLSGLFAALHIQQNHQQINLYTFLIIAVIAVFYLVRWIKNKEFTHIAKAIPLAIFAAAMGVLINALMLFPVFDFAKYSKRGGQLVMDKRVDNTANVVKDNKTVGLTKEYAFDWSYGRAESFSLMFPGVMGYGFHGAERYGETEVFPDLNENSKVAKYFADDLNIPESQASQLSRSIYWGDQPFTMGPVYLGAVICFLFILGMFIVDNKYRWWIFSASLLGIFLALGKHFPAFNYFLFDHMPFYNKLRTPSMALVIPQLLFPLMACLAIDKMISEQVSNNLWNKFKHSLIATAAIFVIAGAMYFTLDYSKENKDRTRAYTAAISSADNSGLEAKLDEINAKYKPLVDNQVYENVLYFTKGDTQKAKGVVTALREDRKSFFGGDILRAFLFVLLTIIIVALFLKNKLNAAILISGLTIVTIADLLPFDAHYLNNKSYANKEELYASEFPLTEADKKILEDKDPNFRVFNLAGGDPFQESKTSYYHKSIGGYHPAKIGIYDDLISYQLSGRFNPAVVNMLNAKYIIQRGDQQSGGPIAYPNKDALGNCWFVKGVHIADNAVEEMKAMDNFTPADTAIVNKEYSNLLNGITPADSTSSIKQTSFDNELIKYESNSNATHLAVFSEIFYKDWKAYIDGKEVPVIKANYVLRALVIPSGKHNIEFKFEPKVFKTSYKISQISSWIMAILILAGIIYFFLGTKSKKND